MSVDDARVVRCASETPPGGQYRCMFADGSLKIIPGFFDFVQQTRATGKTIGDPVIVQQVSGPVVEKRKSDFLVKICLRIADS